MARERLIELIGLHAESAGQTLTKEELADAADSLVSYFGLLIEADKKVTEKHDNQHN